MPKLEYYGIIARPGTFKRKDGSSVTKTWEELKKSFQLTQELKLTLGHPLTPDKRSRPTRAADFLGRIIPVINEEKQVIEGRFKFYDEPWGGIPEHIRGKIVNDEAVSISAGYTSRKQNGVETDMLHDHIALLVEGESPVCPLDECGINVESESGDDEIMTFEQAESTKEAPEEQPTEQPTEEKPQLITFTKDQFDQLLERIKPKEPEPVDAGAAPEEQNPPPEEDETKEEPTPTTEPSSGVPEGAFAAGSPEQKRPNPAIQADGSVVIPVDVYHHRGKKKK